MTNDTAMNPSANITRTVDLPRGNNLDVLNDRYEIHLDQPLEAYGNEICKAYNCTDLTQEYNDLYVLIGDNRFAFRDRTTDAMLKGLIPNLIRCHATGAINLSNPKSTCRAFILQRPRGKKLSEIIKHSGALPERFIIKNILTPLAQVIDELSQHGINHGSLNPENIYFEEKITVDLCSSLPSGYLQQTTYESPERMFCPPEGKGAGDSACDYYAVGILALHLYLGYLPLETKTTKELIELSLKKGCYNAFVPEVDVSDTMQDLFRGCINENRDERWGAPHFNGWLSGKRYSLVAPSPPRDSVRPFDYSGQQYFTRRAIAMALAHDWKISCTSLSGYKLQRWLETNIKQSSIAQSIERVIPIGDPDAQTRPLRDEELARLICMLDPTGPIRFKNTSVSCDGISTSLAAAIYDENAATQSNLLAIIKFNLLNFSNELNNDNYNVVNDQIIRRVTDLQPVIKARSIGFGNERILYQMNPSLCCQHPQLLDKYIYTIDDMLSYLDSIAGTAQAKKIELTDNHIAAFITNRLAINREIRINELARIPELGNHRSLLMLKILTLAQQSLKDKPYVRLGQWVAEMVEPAIENIKQTSLKTRLHKKVMKKANKGIFSHFAFLIFDKQIFENDRKEYDKALALFRFHSAMVEFLSDDRKIKLKARYAGRQIAWFIGGLTLSISLYVTTRPYL